LDKPHAACLPLFAGLGLLLAHCMGSIKHLASKRFENLLIRGTCASYWHREVCVCVFCVVFCLCPFWTLHLSSRERPHTMGDSYGRWKRGNNEGIRAMNWNKSVEENTHETKL
jgi:hypothetical protein